MNNKIGFLAFGVALLTLVGTVAAADAYVNGAQQAGAWTDDGVYASVIGTAQPNVTAGHIYRNSLTGNSSTELWAGLTGDFSGSIYLADNASKVMYSWTFGTGGGFVYATNDTAVPEWSTLAVLNATSLNTQLGYGNYDDNATATFNTTNAADAKIVESNFTAGTVTAALTNPVASNFETQLYQDAAGSLVFAGTLNKTATNYAGGTSDFQLIVPNNIRGTPTTGSTYYLYLELH